MRFKQPFAVPSPFFINPHPRPDKAYHLRLGTVSWTRARDIQNAIVKAYQSHHHSLRRRPLPPTIITLRLRPVFTYGRKEVRPLQVERKMLEGIPTVEGIVADTRMAWSREQGWRFHGPGQVHCWIVADLLDWSV
jgi:lipoate-protein ligase B